MADAETTPKAAEKPAETTPAPAAPETDPYAGLSVEERAAAEAIDRDWKAATPAQRIRWAQEINSALTRKQAEEAAKQQAPPTPKAEEAEPESDVAALKREFNELKAELKAERESARQKREVDQFFSMVDDEIGKVEDLKNKPRLKQLVRNAAAGESVLTKVSDVRALVKRLADGVLEDMRDEREAYAAAKKNSRETGGEGRGGRGAAAEKINIAPGDLSGGKLAKAAKAALLGR